MISLTLSSGVEVTASPMQRTRSGPRMRDRENSPMRPLSQDDTSRVVKRAPHATAERPITIAVPQQATPLFSSITVCVNK